MIEVMIAVAVLALGMFAAMNNWRQVQDTRAETDRIAELNRIMDALQNRCLSAYGRDLGTDTLPWSKPSSPDIYAGGDQSEGMSWEELKAFGIVSEQPDLDNLVVFIRYYRAVDHPRDGLPTLAGLLSLSGDEGGVSRALDASPNPYALAVDESRGLAGMLEDDEIGIYDPVIIRITGHWGPKMTANGLPVRRMDVIASRRPYTDE